MKEFDNYIMLKQEDAEAILQILSEYSKGIRWLVKGVNLIALETRILTQLKETREANATKR